MGWIRFALVLVLSVLIVAALESSGLEHEWVRPAVAGGLASWAALRFLSTRRAEPSENGIEKGSG